MEITSQHMDKVETGERPLSQTKGEIIKEAKRIEEALKFSAKGHFSTADVWSHFHLIVGIPMVILSAVVGASALSRFDPDHVIAGILSILVAVLSGVMTFLNPNEKKSSHLNSGNHYTALQDRVRIFWSIDCWREESEAILTDRLKQFSEQKDKLNQSCPQIPSWAYKIARKGIEGGEAGYTVDGE
jgi:hypothetical protein